MAIGLEDAESVVAKLFHAAMLERLAEWSDGLAKQYQEAHPFPHVVIDDFLPPELLGRALQAYPKPGELNWITAETPTQQKKLTFPEVESLPSELRGLLHFLNTAPVLQFLERLSGIEGVIPDPYYKGGGLHQTGPGGKLGIHTDFSTLLNLRIERRLNLILYMNKDCKEEYGGYLELWEEDMSSCAHSIAPIFNRCLIFTISDDSWHGHPDPLTCPQGMTRKSVTTYYYTSPLPAEGLTQQRATTFQPRPGTRDGQDGYLKAAARAVLPPIAVDGLKRLRRKR